MCGECGVHWSGTFADDHTCLIVKDVGTVLLADAERGSLYPGATSRFVVSPASQISPMSSAQTSG